MKKILILITIAIILVTAVFAQGQKEQMNTPEKTYKVGISKLLTHPALDAIEKGIRDYLTDAEIEVEIHTENANGEISTATSIAQLFKDEKVDIAVGIATPTAQALANTLTDTFQVYSSVTDPVAAGLTGSSNICGVSDMVPVEAHLALIEELTGAKNIGMVYTSSEANGIVLMEAMTKACEAKGVTLIPVAVSNSAEVKVAASSIIDRVDAMYVATDNTVISAISALGDVCQANSIPLFSADTTSSFDSEVLLAGGFDYYKSGLLTGKLVEQVINGESPESIGINYLDTASLELYINLDVAKKLGISIPEEIQQSAVYLIENGSNIK